MAGNGLRTLEGCRLNIEGLRDEMKDSGDFSSSESLGNSNSHHGHKRCSRPNHSGGGGVHPSSGSGPGQCGAVGGSSRAQQQDEILRTLRYLLSRQEVEDHHIRTVNEWRQMAIIIDRVLFWIFLVVTLVSSLLFLVFIPVQRRGAKFV